MAKVKVQFTCKTCKKKIEITRDPRGRKRQYCTPAHRDAAYRKRHNLPPWASWKKPHREH